MGEVLLGVGEKQWRLKPDKIYLIGTEDTESDLFINLRMCVENAVDARHALLEVEKDAVYLLDLLSISGTFLDGKRLESLKRVTLNQEATLRFGTVDVNFETISKEKSHDSSGFHDGPKNASDVLLSPNAPIQECVASTSIASIANKSDSLIVPETQMPPNSTTIEKDDNLAEVMNEDDDSCIPETQQLIPNSISERRERFLAQSATSVKSVTNDNALSQFRIGTQEFNEDFFDGMDSDTNALLGSIVIPQVKHSPVVLHHDDSDSRGAEAYAINSTKDDSNDRLLNSCTPDLFDLPNLTNEVTNQTKSPEIIEKSKTSEKTENLPSSSKEAEKVVEYKKPIDSKKTYANIISDEDLEPTQIFPAARAGAPVVKSGEVFLTLSDKENVLPVKAQTTVVNNVEPALELITTPTTSSTSTSIKNKAERDDDFSLAATQIFPLNKVTTKKHASKCFNSTLVITNDKKKVRNAASFFEDIEHSTVTTSKSTRSARSTDEYEQKTSSTSKTTSSVRSSPNMLSAQSICSDIEVMCTPKIIKDQFGDNIGELIIQQKPKINLKKKGLFGEDSDDSADMLKMLTGPKVSSDFETLLPHLQQQKLEVANSMKKALSKTTFGKFCKTTDEKEKPDNKGAKRGRSERYKTRNSDTTASDKDSSIDRTKTKSARSRNIKEKTEIKTSIGDDSSKASKNSKQKTTTTTTNVVQNTSSKSNTSNRKSHDQSKFESTSEQKTKVIEMPKRRMTRLKSRLLEEAEKMITNDCNELEEPQAKDIARKIPTVQSKELKQQESVIGKEAQQPVRVTRSRSTTTSQESSNSFGQNKRKMEFNDEGPIKRLRPPQSATITTCNTADTNNIKLKVATTMVEPELLLKFEKQKSDIYTIVQNPVDSDILVMDKGNRTFKFLIAMARGIPIVTSKWLDSAQHSIPHIGQYIFTNEAFERRHNFNLLKSLEMARKQKIFAGYEFFCTPNVQPQPNDISEVVKCAGGTMRNDIPRESTNNKKLYLISSSNDKKYWHTYRRLGNGIRIVSTEGIMASVMRQNVKYLDAYILT